MWRMRWRIGRRRLRGGVMLEWNVKSVDVGNGKGIWGIEENNG